VLLHGDWSLVGVNMNWKDLDTSHPPPEGLAHPSPLYP
jgi:hypothetical protein